jgi:glycosyltransferase involved in cell wall biosynthesis
MKTVLIFRHQLFKVSEPFIAQQAQPLQSFKPLYLGRNRLGKAPEGADSLALEDLPDQRSFARRVWQVVTRDPRPYERLLAGQSPALIHAHFGVEGVYALPLARRLRIPLVTTFHGFDATTTTPALLRSGSPAWINYVRFRQQLAKEGDLFLCVSEYIRQRVIELGFPAERTHVHYIGINTQGLQPRDPSLEKPIVLHVARLVEKKGTADLIQAFALATAAISDVELLIVGDGPLRATLEEQARSLGMGTRVRFTGSLPHPQVMALMSQAAMLVLPSVTASSGDAEGLGMVLLEAAAQGIPLIGTLHGGIPEAIDHGQSGYLAPERSVGELALHISTLLGDRALRLKLGQRARQLIERRFDMQRQTAQLESHYRSVLK